MSDLTSKNLFNGATENDNSWAIRYGAEPVDFHLTGRNSSVDNFVEDKLGIKGGIGAFSNHLYIEVGRVDEAGEFETLKRIHGFSIAESDNGELVMARAPEGRAFMMVVDGEHTAFSEDPIYQDDPHASKENQLQSAGDNFWLGDDANKIVFQGAERDVLQLYGAMIRTTIELNNQDLEYSALADFLGGSNPNGNSLSGELREKLQEMSVHMGIEIGDHDPSGWDVGLNLELQTQEASPVATWESIDELRDYVDSLEQAASKQLETLKNDGVDADLETETPAAKPLGPGI